MIRILLFILAPELTTIFFYEYLLFTKKIKEKINSENKFSKFIKEHTKDKLNLNIFRGV